MRFGDTGILLVIADEAEGLTLWLGYDPPSPGRRGWIETVDPELALQWVGDARAVLEYDGPVDAPYVEHPDDGRPGPPSSFLAPGRQGGCSRDILAHILHRPNYANRS